MDSWTIANVATAGAVTLEWGRPRTRPTTRYPSGSTASARGITASGPRRGGEDAVAGGQITLTWDDPENSTIDEWNYKLVSVTTAEGLTAEPGDTQVTLRWTDPDNPTGITEWLYSYREGGGSWTNGTVSGGGTARSHTVTGLNNELVHNLPGVVQEGQRHIPVAHGEGYPRARRRLEDCRRRATRPITAYTQTDLDNGTTYVYKVRAGGLLRRVGGGHGVRPGVGCAQRKRRLEGNPLRFPHASPPTRPPTC